MVCRDAQCGGQPQQGGGVNCCDPDGQAVGSDEDATDSDCLGLNHPMSRILAVKKEFCLSVHASVVDLNKTCLVTCFALLASVHYVVAGFFVREQFLHAYRTETAHVGFRSSRSGRYQSVNENPFGCRVVGYACCCLEPTDHLHKPCC